jgi:hypothetical protein
MPARSSPPSGTARADVVLAFLDEDAAVDRHVAQRLDEARSAR